MGASPYCQRHRFVNYRVPDGIRHMAGAPRLEIEPDEGFLSCPRFMVATLFAKGTRSTDSIGEAGYWLGVSHCGITTASFCGVALKLQRAMSLSKQHCMAVFHRRARCCCAGDILFHGVDALNQLGRGPDIAGASAGLL